MYVVENWFDYEIGGKIPLSLLESQFNEEYNNFEKMMNAIDVISESSIAILAINEDTIVDKIKELWKRFKAWIKGIISKIFNRKNKVDSLTNQAMDIADNVGDDSFKESSYILEEDSPADRVKDEDGQTATLHYYTFIFTKDENGTTSKADIPTNHVIVSKFATMNDAIQQSLQDFKKIQVDNVNGWDEFAKPLHDIGKISKDWEIEKDTRSFGTAYTPGKEKASISSWVDGLKKVKKMTDAAEKSIKEAADAVSKAEQLTQALLPKLAKNLNTTHNKYDYDIKTGNLSKTLTAYVGSLKACEQKMMQLYNSLLSIQQEYAMTIIRVASRNKNTLKDANKGIRKASKYL